MKKTLSVIVSEKNTKMGRVPNISMTAIVSCRNCKACKHDCYALKAYRQYPDTRHAWDSNIASYRRNPEKYFTDIIEYLSRKRKLPFFRWHVAGDILGQKYLRGMYRVAEAFPNTLFLAFTKMYNLDYSAKPKNLSIVFSSWVGVDVPRVKNIPVAWYQDGTETRVPENAIRCPGNCETCGMCFDLPSIGRDVVFEKH